MLMRQLQKTGCGKLLELTRFYDLKTLKEKFINFKKVAF